MRIHVAAATLMPMLLTTTCNLSYPGSHSPSFQQRREPWDLDELEKDDEDSMQV